MVHDGPSSDGPATARLHRVETAGRRRSRGRHPASPSRSAIASAASVVVNREGPRHDRVPARGVRPPLPLGPGACRRSGRNRPQTPSEAPPRHGWHPGLATLRIRCGPPCSPGRDRARRRRSVSGRPQRQPPGRRGRRLADLDHGDAAGRQDPSLDPRSELLALLLLYEELRDGRSVQVKGVQRGSN